MCVDLLFGVSGMLIGGVSLCISFLADSLDWSRCSRGTKS